VSLQQLMVGARNPPCMLSLPNVVLRDARQVLGQSWKTSLPVDTPITQTQYYSDLAGGGEMKFL
jgi:hypothetical protein